VSNPFGRVPQGIRLTTLRSVLGRKIAVVDYRLATPEQRTACTLVVQRPLARLDADYTFRYAYRDQIHVVYDVGTDGTAQNVSLIESYPGEWPKTVRDLDAAARTAAMQTRYQPPQFKGAPLYCINVTERFSKVGDGDGGFRSLRDFDPVFGKRDR
jgi:hypothetical protein